MTNDFHYAVVVGINRYPGIRDLGKPRKDAQGFRDWLISEEGGRVPEENVRPLEATDDEERTFLDALGSRPRGDELEKDLVRIHEMQKAGLEKDPSGWYRSRLYVYVSGHGIAPADGVGAYQFADADPRRDYWDHAEFSALKEWYEKTVLFREVIFFADCCRERRPFAPGYKPKFGMPRENYGPSMECVLAYATEYGGKAFEAPDDEVESTYGFFTAALLEGLKGGAANPDTGEILSSALATYVQDWIDAKTGGTQYHQRSIMTGNIGEAMVLRPAGLGVLPRKRWRMNLQFPAGFASRAELLRKGRLTGDEWDAARGPWRIELDEDRYQVRASSDAVAGPIWEFTVVARGRDVRL